jgi:hypothetical protein
VCFAWEREWEEIIVRGIEGCAGSIGSGRVWPGRWRYTRVTVVFFFSGVWREFLAAMVTPDGDCSDLPTHPVFRLLVLVLLALLTSSLREDCPKSRDTKAKNFNQDGKKVSPSTGPLPSSLRP